MKYYCKFCGAEVSENGICSCAEAQNAEAQKSSTKSQNSSGVIICAFAVVLVIIIAIIFGGGGYKKPVDKFFTGIQKCSVNTVAKSLPKESADEFKNDTSDEDLETLIGILELGYGNDVKISYDIEDKQSLDEDEIEKLENSTGLSIKKAYNLSVNVKFKGKKNEDENTVDITVVKIKGEGWKLLDNGISDLF